MIYDKYEINKDSGFGSMFWVSPNGKGGSIPTVLSGLFTSVPEAIKAIDMYKSSFKTKVKSNAAKVSNG